MIHDHQCQGVAVQPLRTCHAVPKWINLGLAKALE
jgi:hypothetical protein